MSPSQHPTAYPPPCTAGGYRRAPDKAQCHTFGPDHSAGAVSVGHEAAHNGAFSVADCVAAAAGAGAAVIGFQTRAANKADHNREYSECRYSASVNGVADYFSEHGATDLCTSEGFTGYTVYELCDAPHVTNCSGDDACVGETKACTGTGACILQ